MDATTLVAQTTRKAKRMKLADEEFIGMWRDCEDIRNSSAKVRGCRESEWAV